MTDDTPLPFPRPPAHAEAIYPDGQTTTRFMLADGFTVDVTSYITDSRVNGWVVDTYGPEHGGKIVGHVVLDPGPPMRHGTAAEG